LGALGGHLLTKECDLGCSEDVLRRVDEGSVPLQSVKESPWLLPELLERPGENQDVVQVGEAEFEYSQNVVHEALERLCGNSHNIHFYDMFPSTIRPSSVETIAQNIIEKVTRNVKLI
jgi:hypothetical protein